MNKYFVRDTSLANAERMMMAVPNFTPRSTGSAILCGSSSRTAAVCRICVERRRQSCRSLHCLHITERLQNRSVTIAELVAEMVRPWKHLGLKRRAVDIAGQVREFHFEGQLHIARMLKMTGAENTDVSSRWLAAVYLLAAHAALWQKALTAVMPGRIDFSCMRLKDVSVQEYVLYRAAKGLCTGTLGATSEELADPELVDDGTLLLVLCTVLIARYGPEVANVGRAGR